MRGNLQCAETDNVTLKSVDPIAETGPASSLWRDRLVVGEVAPSSVLPRHYPVGMRTLIQDVFNIDRPY